VRFVRFESDDQKLPMLDDLHVLLVDDDVDSNEMYVYSLTDLGARVTTATSVRQAFELFLREPPDVLVSDITLVGSEDGYTLVREVRALDPDAGGLVPAIALTGWARGVDRRRARAEGFDEHLEKPCLPQDLAAAISRQVEATREIRARATRSRTEQHDARQRLEARQQELTRQRERLERRSNEDES
jgi:CheY-like chemotaxis protein